MTELLLTSSVLIAALLVLRRVLRGKLSLRLQYALWALVAVRLLVPVSLGASPVSVLNAVPETGGMEALYLSPVRDSLVPADGRQEPVTQYDYRPAQLAPASPNNVVSYVDRYDVSHRVEYARQIDLPSLLRPVWLLGAALMAVWFFAVNLSFRRKLKNAVLVEITDCPLPVFSLEGLPSPCLAGLFKPAIYITPACLEDEERLRHVLAHELTHWRHKDPFWSLVRCLCLSIYWFHPLVWLAAFLSRRDCELACDEGALARLGEDERTAYGRTLIGLMAVSSSPAHLLQTATTMVDRKKGVKERLTLIAQKPKMLAVTAVAVVLAAAALAVCTFTGAAEEAPARYATVEEALADMPVELRLSEEFPSSGITAYTPENGPGYLELEENEIFRGYWTVYLYLSSDLSNPLGWLGSVYRLDQASYDALCADGGSGASFRPNAFWECFAKDGSDYYLIHAPMTAPELRSDLTDGAQLQEKLLTWIKEAVFASQGVSAIPEQHYGPVNTAGPMPSEPLPQASASFSQTSVVERLLSADEVILTRMGGESYSTPPDGWDCLLGDNTLRSFLMDYYEMDPISVVGQGSPEDAWTYSISTADGSVCLIAHEISGLVTWIVDGQETHYMASPVTSEISPIGEKLADWYEQLELQWISGKITSLSDGELFQFLLDLDASYYLSNAQHELGERFLARPGDILALVEAARGSRPALWDGDGAEWFTGLLIAEFAANRPGEVQSALDALSGFAEGDYGGAVGALRASLGRSGTEADAQTAYEALLAGDFTVLVPWQQGEYWANSIYWTGLEYMTLDLDGDGVSELITRFKDSPASQNAVFHYAGGQVDCWRWDGMDGGEFSYPLRDGTMVYEFRSGGSSLRSYTLFYYNAQGQPLNIVMLSASSGDSAVYTIDGEDVSRAQFEAKFDELITSRLPGPEAWTPLVPLWEG